MLAYQFDHMIKRLYITRLFSYRCLYQALSRQLPLVNIQGTQVLCALGRYQRSGFIYGPI